MHPKFPPGGLGGFGGDQLWETFLETWFFKESVISPVNRTLAIENLDPLWMYSLLKNDDITKPAMLVYQMVD